MAEETKEPVRIFPKVHAARASASPALIYVLVSISAIALVPADRAQRGRRPRCSRSSRRARPAFPLDHLRVHHDVRGRQLGAHQHAHGQPAGLRHGHGSGCSRRLLGRVLPGRRTPVAGDPVHHAARLRPDHRSWAQVAASAARPRCCCSSSSPSSTSPSSCSAATPSTPTTSARRRCCPSLGRSPAAYLATPFAGGPSCSTSIAGVLLAIGVVLWGSPSSSTAAPDGGPRGWTRRTWRGRSRRLSRPALQRPSGPGDGVSTPGAASVVAGGTKVAQERASGPWTAAFLSVHPVSWTAETASNRLSAVLRPFCPVPSSGLHAAGCANERPHVVAPTEDRERLLRQFHHRPRGARGGPQAPRYVHRLHR